MWSQHRLLVAPVPIVADGLQATRTIGEGRWIPILVLDFAGRPDLEGLFEAAPERPGEVQTQWGYEKKHPTSFLLFVSFQQPLKCEFHLIFEASRNGVLVDYALDAEAVYLQSGSPGNRVRDLTTDPRILLEVPAPQAVRERWEEIFQKGLKREFQKRGLPRKSAKNAAIKAIKNLRLIRQRRLKPLS